MFGIRWTSSGLNGLQDFSAAFSDHKNHLEHLLDLPQIIYEGEMSSLVVGKPPRHLPHQVVRWYH